MEYEDVDRHGHDDQNNDDDDDGLFEDQNYTYFFEFSDLTADVTKPLSVSKSSTGRLRYTCSDVSPNVTPVLESPSRYVALGTTSGSVHVFQHCRDDLPPLQPSQQSQQPNINHNASTNTNNHSLPTSVTSSTNSLVIDGTTSLNHTKPQPQPPVPNSTHQHRKVPPSATHHLLKIIHEDLIGPITSLAFAPIQLLVSRPRAHEQSNSPLTKSSSSDNSSSSPSSPPSCDTPNSIDQGHQSTSYPFNGHSHTHSGRSASQHHLTNILLAIGTSKGNILIVDINLQSQSTDNSQSTFLKLSKYQSSVNKRWSITYQNSSFSREPITLLRWDNASRLFIGDSSGKVFVLHDIEEMKHLMILTTPALLLNLNGVSIHQFDVADKLAIFSTAEQRVFLLNLDDSTLTQIGKVTRAKKKDRFQSSGVCALSTFRLVELNSFHYEDHDDDEDSLYPEPVVTKAYRLVSTECQLFVTRPKCRLWVVDLDGQVQFTHQFGEAIEDGSNASNIFGDQTVMAKVFVANQQEEQNQHQNGGTEQQEATNFGKLYPMYWRDPYDTLKVFSYVVTYTEQLTSQQQQSTRVFVIDLNRHSIVASSSPLNGRIIELKCVGNDIFVSYHQSSENNNTFAMCVLTLNAKGQFEDDATSPRTISSLSEQCSANFLENISPTESVTHDVVDGGQVNDSPPSSATEHVESTVNHHLETAQLLHQYLLSSSVLTEDNHLSKCACGLPLAAGFDCDHFEPVKLSKLLGNLDSNVAFYLLELSYTNGNWPLYMFLLAQLGESKFYLYFAILLDEPCLITQHWNMFGRDILSCESLWQDIFEYIGLSIFRAQSGSSSQIVSSFSPKYSNVNSSTDEPTDGDDERSKVKNTTSECVMCRLKQLAQTDQWEPIVTWFERRLLRYCLLHCSSDFATRMMNKIISKFVEPQVSSLTVDHASHQPTESTSTTNLFSLDFYMLLLRFEVMKASTNHLSAQLLTRLQQLSTFSTTTNNSKLAGQSNKASSSKHHHHHHRSIAVPKVSKVSGQVDQNRTGGGGRAVDLSKCHCAFCHKPILPPNAKVHSLTRRQIKLYRSCEHVFHSTCTLTRRCTLCHGAK